MIILPDCSETKHNELSSQTTLPLSLIITEQSAAKLARESVCILKFTVSAEPELQERKKNNNSNNNNTLQHETKQRLSRLPYGGAEGHNTTILAKQTERDITLTHLTLTSKILSCFYRRAPDHQGESNLEAAVFPFELNYLRTPNYAYLSTVKLDT